MISTRAEQPVEERPRTGRPSSHLTPSFSLKR